MPKTQEGWIPKQNRKMLTCRECKDNKSPMEFLTKGLTKSGFVAYHSRCKPCYYRHIKRPVVYVSPKVRPKMLIIQAAKQQCMCCGYNRCMKALEFHHIDESTKLFDISDYGSGSITCEMVEVEIQKCVVLCSNCHKELHAGMDVVFERK